MAFRTASGSPPVASSSTEGFFQALPTLVPQYTLPTEGASTSQQESSDDVVLDRVLALYLPKPALREVGTAMHNLSRRVLLPSVLAHVVDAETNVPTLSPLTTFGTVNKNDPLRTCAGWKALKAIGIEEGTVARGYDTTKTQHNRRVDQFAIHHVWNPTSTVTLCPMAMADGAAALLRRHLDDTDGDQPGRGSVIREAYRRLVSADPAEAWTSGQWMTERTGGSDVSGTETRARRMTPAEIAQDTSNGRTEDAHGMPLGPWCIDGFKWFSSATDSDMAVLLAQTDKGLSTFMVPMRRASGRVSNPVLAGSSEPPASELNGIRIQRLKNKMGTKGLPTAELELKGARGWLVGEEGRGVKEISAILNITRIHTGTASASYWARAMMVCRAYSQVRKAGGRFLHENLQHSYWMAGLTVQYWATTQLAFFGAALLGCSEQGAGVAKGTPSAVLFDHSPEVLSALLRLLTPVMKAQCSMESVNGIRAGMECLGGVGYCENNEDGATMNIGKLFRDCVVNTIWEGTVSVMAHDVARVIKDRRIVGGQVMRRAFAVWVEKALSGCKSRFSEERAVVEERLQSLLDLVDECGSDPHKLEYNGRVLLEHLEAITCGVLLLHDANSDGDLVASNIASRYVWSKAVSNTRCSRARKLEWQTEADMDRRIFLGGAYVPVSPPRTKL